MKSTSTLLSRSNRRIILLLFSSLLLLPVVSFSQNPLGRSTKQNDTCVLTSFSGKCVNRVNYLNCTVQSSISNYYLVIEKSVDGKTFLPVGLKKGFISPGKQPLLFSFTDSVNASAQVTYKILAYKSPDLNNAAQEDLILPKNMFGEFDNSVIYINTFSGEDNGSLTRMGTN